MAKFQLQTRNFGQSTHFTGGMDIILIMSELGIRTPTVEVYLINAMCAAKAVNRVRLADLLAVNEDHSVLMQKELLLKTHLSEVKQSCPGFPYNQIHFVLLCFGMSYPHTASLICDCLVLVRICFRGCCQNIFSLYCERNNCKETLFQSYFCALLDT